MKDKHYKFGKERKYIYPPLMTREIKFRAQRPSGEWIYLALEDIVNDPRLRAEWRRLENKSEYTGLKDKNGDGLQEVYEDDIISEKGLIKGNIHENKEDFKEGFDIVVPKIGTKAWQAAYKKIVDRGFGYAI